MSEGLICTLTNKVLGYTEDINLAVCVQDFKSTLYDYYFNYNAAFKNRAAMAGTGFKYHSKLQCDHEYVKSTF